MSVNSFSGQPAIPASYGFTAGKNKIINGDFGIWQRGTSFSAQGYTADRWYFEYSGGTFAISQQAFTAGTAPVTGYEGTYYLRMNKTASGAGYFNLQQRIEDVRTFANQTVTISFWAKADATVTNEPYIMQNFGSGGSSNVYTALSTQTLTTSWARYSVTIAVPSIAGKTIGTSSYLLIYPIRVTDSATHTIDVWGVQVEAGATATSFQTATGNIQGELAACQRYYFRNMADLFSQMGTGINSGTTAANINIPAPVAMRVVPTSVDYSNLAVFDTGTYPAVTSVTLQSNQSSPQKISIAVNVASGLTQYRPVFLISNNSATGYLGFSAEL